MATVPQHLSRAVAAALAGWLLPCAALADEAKAPAAAQVDASAAPATPAAVPKATRRSGFVVGLAFGFGAASVVGYPNDVRKIGFAGSYTATGARPGALGQLWIGGALTDWFTFGLGFTGGSLFATGDNKVRTGGGLFHIEAFPLFSLGARLRDLGVMIDAGLGTATVTDAMSTKIVDSSSASLIGGGVFYEGIRLWKVAQGPFLMGNYMWSDTARRPAIFAGWRASLYTGP
jgi:hypothetical protein